MATVSDSLPLACALAIGVVLGIGLGLWWKVTSRPGRAAIVLAALVGLLIGLAVASDLRASLRDAATVATERLLLCR